MRAHNSPTTSVIRPQTWLDDRAAAGLAAALGRLAISLGPMTSSHIGVDMVFTPGWERHLKSSGQALLDRVYTEAELRYAAGRMDRLATRLAAKEAVLKVLGTGIGRVALRHVEVRVNERGKPTIALLGPAAELSRQQGLEGIAISLCHEGDYAIAVAAGIRSLHMKRAKRRSVDGRPQKPSGPGLRGSQPSARDLS